jgi:hypothetical protein
MISIVTPSFNRAAMIRDAIESVLAQGYTVFEHIVIDGNSDDGTASVLLEYPHLRVVREPDSGMYDAINKGLQLASGEIIGLLNTDDLYAPGAFDAVAHTFAENPDALAVVGRAQVFSAAAGRDRLVREDPAIESDEFWYRVIQGHPVTNAWFFRREVFGRVGLLDTGYRFAADREFLIRAALAGVRPVTIPVPLYLYRQHPGSATISPEDSRQARRGAQRLLVLSEGMRLLEGFLGQDGIPAEARRHLKSAHSAACYRATATAVYHRRFSTALTAIRQGFRFDPLWPTVFIRMAWHRALQEFGLRRPA